MPKAEKLEAAALQLMDDLSCRYAGETASFRSYSRLSKTRPEYRNYLVPSTFIGKINDYDTTIQVHYGRLKPQCCYLMIKLHLPSQNDLVIRHEDITEKMRKFFGFSDEFQTGDIPFDKRYLLNVSSHSDKELLCDKDFRRSITDLEPFRSLSITPHEIVLCRDMKTVDDLQILKIQPILENLWKIARKTHRN